MNALIALVFALTLHTNLREPAHLYQHSGTMDPLKQLVVPFSAKQDLPIKVEVHGDGNGDLDCYLLKYNPTPNGQGWVIADKDESNTDRCYITFTPTTDSHMRFWAINNGTKATNYSATVDQ